MQKTLAEIAEIIGGEVVGDANTVIRGLSGIFEAKDGDLTFIANNKYIAMAKRTKASAILTPRDLDISDKPIVKTDNPSLAFSQLIGQITPQIKPSFMGVHPSAVLGANVTIGKNVVIGPCTVIEDDVSIADNSIISGGSYIGSGSSIGENVLIYPNVTLREQVTIGDRVSIHSGTVVGSDGYGYVNVDGQHVKIPQIGTVIIEEDVELGANVCIDRARFDKTVIGAGTKIDNLVQIAHNVELGKNCLIVSQCGISGSTVIEDNVILAGQCGVAGHIRIGKNTMVGAKSGVANSVPENTKFFGIPAREMSHSKRVNAATQMLPDYVKKIRDLEKRIEELEQN